MGFKSNPYDRCVMNKMINGKQCTLCFYVDDNKISHVEEEVLEKIVKEISEYFGDLKIYRGNKHTFLGMNVTITNDHNIEIEMTDQLKKTIQAFGEPIAKSMNTPASAKLLPVDEKSELLKQEEKEIFHTVTAKLLYLCKRCSPDIETAVSFFCTRVQNTTREDWKKIKRTLGYIYGTLDMTRIISCDQIDVMFTWIDAAYAV